jgi:hypothetical protein
MGRRIGAVDPTTKWASAYMPCTMLLYRLVDRSQGSYYSMGNQIDAMWILPHQIGQRIGAVDPTTQ